MTSEIKAEGPSRSFDTSLLSPPDSYTVPSAPELSAEQQIKLKEVEEHFSKEGFTLPLEESTAGDAEERGLSEREMMFLSRETFLRFITATKGDTREAIKRLEACIIWRRSVDIDNVQAMADDCEPESKTGKNLVMGFSPRCQPVMYFFPNRNTTPVNERRIVHSLFLLERARDLFPAGVTNVIVIFNFAGKREGPPSSVSNARQLLYILGQHYPETLAISFFQDLHWIIKGFINLMWPFVDPNTKRKVKFGSVEVGELTRDKDVGSGQLLKECGGDLDIPYNHEDYWTPMVKTCLETRAKQEEAFRGLGEPRVGREERLWRSVHQPGASPVTNGVEKPTPTADVTVESNPIAAAVAEPTPVTAAA